MKKTDFSRFFPEKDVLSYFIFPEENGYIKKDPEYSASSPIYLPWAIGFTVQNQINISKLTEEELSLLYFKVETLAPKSIYPVVSLAVLNGGLSPYDIGSTKYEEALILEGFYANFNTVNITFTFRELLERAYVLNKTKTSKYQPTSELEKISYGTPILVKSNHCEWIEDLRKPGKGHTSNQVNVLDPYIRTVEEFITHKLGCYFNETPPLTFSKVNNKSLTDLINILS